MAITDIIKPEYAQTWLKIATDVQEVLKDFDTSDTREVKDVLADIKARLDKTEYQIASDYDNTYKYFDYDVFTQDRRFGIRIFLGNNEFGLYLHNIDTMYLYAPNDEYDVLDDVTIADIKRAVKE